MSDNIFIDLLSADLVSLSFSLFPHYHTHPASHVHYELADLLCSDSSVIVALPREFAKSTYVWVFFPAWNILHGRYRYIVYIANSVEKAKSHFRNLRTEVFTHPVLSACIEILKNSEVELEYKDLISNQTCLIQVFGAGQNLRGLRYLERRPDIVIVDDVESLESVMSEAQREKLKEWFYADVLPLSSSARFFIIGTVLHQDSLLSNLIENPPNEWRVIKHAIIENEKPTWASKFPMQKILELKETFRKQGLLSRFYSEYMNEPVADETQIFKASYFRYYDPSVLRIDELNVYTTVDLAISQKESADYTAICTVGVNSEGHWFVLDVSYGRWNPSEQVEMIFKTVQKFNPLFVGIETVAYQSALLHFIQKEQVARNVFFRIRELEARGKKETRILTLSARYASGTIWHPAQAHFLTELEGELLSFPKGKHDDLIDALAYVEQIAEVPSHRSTTVKLPTWSL